MSTEPTKKLDEETRRLLREAAARPRAKRCLEELADRVEEALRRLLEREARIEAAGRKA